MTTITTGPTTEQILEAISEGACNALYVESSHTQILGAIYDAVASQGRPLPPGSHLWRYDDGKGKRGANARKPKCKGMTTSRYDGEGNLLAASRPCRANASGDSDYCAHHDPVRKRRKALETELAERISIDRHHGIDYDKILDWGANNDKSADEVRAEMAWWKSEVIGKRREAYDADPEIHSLVSNLPTTLPDNLFEMLAVWQTSAADVREGLRLAAYSPRDVEPWQLQLIVWAWTRAPVRKLAAHEPQAACLIMRDLGKYSRFKDVEAALREAFGPKPREKYAFAKRRPVNSLAKPVSPFQSWKTANAEFLAALKEYVGWSLDRVQEALRSPQNQQAP